MCASPRAAPPASARPMEGWEGIFGLGSLVFGFVLVLNDGTLGPGAKTEGPRPLLLYRIQRHNLRAFSGCVEKRVRVGFYLRLLQCRLNFCTSFFERWHNASTRTDSRDINIAIVI